jgi:hypothetical protein
VHLGSKFPEFCVHLGSKLLELGSKCEAKFVVLDGQSFKGDGMLDGHVDDVVHAPLCAREANVGSFSRNSKLVKHFQGAASGSEEGEAAAGGLAERGDRVAVRRR